MGSIVDNPSASSRRKSDDLITVVPMKRYEEFTKQQNKKATKEQHSNSVPQQQLLTEFVPFGGIVAEDTLSKNAEDTSELIGLYPYLTYYGPLNTFSSNSILEIIANIISS
eukprot:410472_1